MKVLRIGDVRRRRTPAARFYLHDNQLRVSFNAAARQLFRSRYAEIGLIGAERLVFILRPDKGEHTVVLAPNGEISLASARRLEPWLAELAGGIFMVLTSGAGPTIDLTERLGTARRRVNVRRRTAGKRQPERAPNTA